MRLMYLVGIAGGSGSGKTTFAHKVFDRLDHKACLISMDSYYLDVLPDNLLTAKGNPNFDHPQAFDWELLFNHLAKLKEGETIQSPLYDFKTNSRKEETVSIAPERVIIFEGIFSLFDKNIRDLMDIKCFLHVEADIRFTRRLHRDVNERGRSLESVIGQYYETVRPMYLKYLEPQKQFADFTVGEETDVAADILAARLKEYLNE
ncbi:MAG: uridine kinase [Halobacteriovoraceae bacterium]|nr:uridine kinase [Halobacteriovoraceae bacterium]